MVALSMIFNSVCDKVIIIDELKSKVFSDFSAMIVAERRHRMKNGTNNNNDEKNDARMQ